MWVVLKAYPWSSLETNLGTEVTMAKGDGLPTHFLPVFQSLEDAQAWGAADHEIMKVTPRGSLQ